MGERSLRSVAKACGMNHETLRGVLAGQVWPDMLTVARLEAGFAQSLWPALHPREAAAEVDE